MQLQYLPQVELSSYSGLPLGRDQVTNTLYCLFSFLEAKYYLTTHYHQWLHTAIPFKTKFVQIPSDSVRVQGLSKRQSSGHLCPVSSVKERNQKGGKCKISRVLQSPVPSTQASPKVEASHRPKQAQHFSTRRKVQNGNSRVHQDLPDSRGMGIVNRPIRRLPSHPHPSKLKEIPKVLLQVPGVPVHLPPIRTSHSPQVFTMIIKEVKLMALSRGLRLHQYLDDWLIRSRSQEKARVNTQAVVDLTQSLGWIINQEKLEMKPTQVFSFVGYEYHLDSALVKPTQDRWLKQNPSNVMRGADLHPKVSNSLQTPQMKVGALT